jgi:hypothetical protein
MEGNHQGRIETRMKWVLCPRSAPSQLLGWLASSAPTERRWDRRGERMNLHAYCLDTRTSFIYRIFVEIVLNLKLI